MMPFARQLRAALRLDLGEVLRSRWIASASAVYLLLSGGLVLVGLRESTVLGFSGMDRVLLSFAHLLLVVLPLLALTGTAQVVPRARDDGTLELLFSHPLSRTGFLTALGLGRFLALAAPLAALLLAMGLVGRLAFGEPVAWGMLGRAVAVGVALLWAFVGVGLYVSVAVRHEARAVVTALVVWGLSVAFLDLALLGAMLQWRVEPRLVFGLAAVNPVQTARLALLSGIEPDLATLGPVGFFLVHRVGGGVLLALGLGWPLVAGLAGWLAALTRFRRDDLL